MEALAHRSLNNDLYIYKYRITGMIMIIYYAERKIYMYIYIHTLIHAYIYTGICIYVCTHVCIIQRERCIRLIQRLIKREITLNEL